MAKIFLGRGEWLIALHQSENKEIESTNFNLMAYHILFINVKHWAVQFLPTCCVIISPCNDSGIVEFIYFSLYLITWFYFSHCM